MRLSTTLTSICTEALPIAADSLVDEGTDGRAGSVEMTLSMSMSTGVLSSLSLLSTADTTTVDRAGELVEALFIGRGGLMLCAGAVVAEEEEEEEEGRRTDNGLSSFAGVTDPVVDVFSDDCARVARAGESVAADLVGALFFAIPSLLLVVLLLLVVAAFVGRAATAAAWTAATWPRLDRRSVGISG